MSVQDLQNKYDELKASLDKEIQELLEQWPAIVDAYNKDFYEYKIRDKIIRRELTTRSLSGTTLRKVVLPK